MADVMEMRKGYKQTEVGVIPEDWDVKKMDEIANVKTGPFGSALHEKDYVQDGTPIITVEHLGEQGIINENLPMVSDLDKNRLNGYSLRAGDIVFSRVGSVDRNSLIRNREQGWLFSGRLLRIRLTKSNVLSNYLSYYFHQETTKQRIRSVAVGQTMASLNTKIMKGISVALPPTKAEQTAIAKVLTDADTLITQLEKLIAKKRDIKQGALQELLKPKEGWEVKKLKEVFKFLRTANNPRSDLMQDGEFEYIHYGDIHTRWNRFLDCSKNTLPFISNAKIKNIPFLQEGDLIIADASEDYEGLGVCIEIKNIGNRKIVAGLHTMLLRGDKEILIDGFKGYLRDFYGVKEALIASSTGVSVYGISKSKLKNIEITIPSNKTEQTRIARILSDMDAEIEALEKKLEKYKSIKQGMMQVLLTGRIRLV
jgi:type I restriction enzyme S subunit